MQLHLNHHTIQIYDLLKYLVKSVLFASLALPFSASGFSFKTECTYPNLMQNQQQICLITALAGAKFEKKKELNLNIAAKSAVTITSLATELYYFDTGKQRIIIKDQDVGNIMIKLKFGTVVSPVSANEKVAINPIYNNTIANLVSFKLLAKEPLKLSVDVDEKKIADSQTPARYTLLIGDDKKFQKDQVITVKQSSDLLKSTDLKLSIDAANADDAEVNGKNIKITQATDSITINVAKQKDVPYSDKDIDFTFDHTYLNQDFDSIEIVQKANTVGGSCMPLSYDTLDAMPGGACYNIHVGTVLHLDDAAERKPKPIFMFVSRHKFDLFNGETFFESSFYDLPALISPVKKSENSVQNDNGTTTTTIEEVAQSDDNNPFVNQNSVFQIAMGAKFNFTSMSTYNGVIRIEAKKIPSSIHSVALGYEVGIERVVNFGTNASGRGIAGFSYAKDEFWQYDDISDPVHPFQDNKERFKIYGTIALNESNTALLHGFINTHTKGNGPTMAGIRLTYGGGWEQLVKRMAGD